MCYRVLQPMFVIKLDSKKQSRLGKAHKNLVFTNIYTQKSSKSSKYFEFDTQFWVESSSSIGRQTRTWLNSKTSKNLRFFALFFSSRVMYWLNWINTPFCSNVLFHVRPSDFFEVRSRSVISWVIVLLMRLPY